MRRPPSFLQLSSVLVLLIFSLFASAFPHSYTPRATDEHELELYEYPPPSPIAIIELGAKKITPSDEEDSPGSVSYDVEWMGEDMVKASATAMEVEEDEYEGVVRWYQIMGTFLAAGQDKEKQLWVITKREEEPADTGSSESGEEDYWLHRTE